ncbi:response regulator [Candidatus Omnitrophota bacterium]
MAEQEKTIQKESRIVIADDNHEICDLISDILKDVGYNVDAVHTGYELLAYLETNNPRVIILDLMMPDKDGMSILGTLKEVSPLSRIIIYTGYSEYQNSVYARAADRFIVKGSSIQGLLDAIEELS